MRWLNFGEFMALANVFAFLFPISMSVNVDPNCDMYQEMALGQLYYIYNKEYPQYYGPNTACRWTAQSPPGTNIVLACELIEIPSSQNCVEDRLAVSLTGNADFNDAHNYCGTGSITLVTDSNQLVVGLFSTSNTRGGRFVCSITAMQSGPQPTTEPPLTPCDCGWRGMSRIVGGSETGVNEFPLMAGIVDRFTTEVFCGGSIISEWFVLTAAHCLVERNPSEHGVLVGDHDLNTGNDTSYASLYAAQRFIVHQQYSGSPAYRNDIGLIRTAKQIVFSQFVGPVCLPFRYTNLNSFDGKSVILLGWGSTEFSGPKSNVLNKVEVNTVTNEKCATDPALAQQGITYNQMCTYSPGKDSCLADSGGPTLYYDPSKRRLILAGVISYGLGCASPSPAVETRVSQYLSWIVAETGNAGFCIK